MRCAMSVQSSNKRCNAAMLTDWPMRCNSSHRKSESDLVKKTTTKITVRKSYETLNAYIHTYLVKLPESVRSPLFPIGLDQHMNGTRCCCFTSFEIGYIVCNATIGERWCEIIESEWSNRARTMNAKSNILH